MQKLVYWKKDEELQWLLLDSAGQLKESGCLKPGLEEQLPVCFAEERYQVMLLPALDVGLRDVYFSSEEKRHINKTLPYQLEELLPCDIESLVIVNEKPAANSVRVAYCDQETLAAHIEFAGQFDLKPIKAFPQQVYFSAIINDQTWLQLDDIVICQLDGSPFGYHQDELQLLLDDGSVQLPEKLLQLQLGDGEKPESFSLQGEVASEPLEELSTAVANLNFLVGRFADNQDLIKFLRFCRPVAIAASIVAVLFTTVLFIEHGQLKQDNLELRRQVETSFRKVQPSGAVYQPRKQMEKLLSVYGANQSSGFSTLLAAMQSPLNKQDKLEINTIAYDEKSAELRVELVLADFSALEKLQKDALISNLQVELQSSTSQPGGLRAKLKVKGANS